MIRRAIRTIYPFFVSVLALLCAQSAYSIPEIGLFSDFELVSSRRVSRVAFEVEFRAVLFLPDANARGVNATISSLGGGIEIVDDDLDFGDLDSPGDHASLDTFSFRIDRRFPFDPSNLVINLEWENRPPTAVAGPDRTVDVGGFVSLDGSASTDPDGDPLSYAWALISGPPGTTAQIANETEVLTNFVADEPGRYVIELVVNDGIDESLPDTLTIDTNNSLPTADAGPDQTAPVGETLTLDGSGSSDPDGDLLTYAWRFLSVPTGSSPSLSNSGAIMPRFTIDRAGSYEIELTVNDGTGESAPDLVRVDTENSAPVADPGTDQTVRIGETAFLDGTASSDVDGDPLSFTWALITLPTGSSAVLDDPAVATPTFVVDEPGTYVAQLIVSDGTVQSTPRTVRIVTENSPPQAVAGPDQNASIGLIPLDGSASSDVDGDPLTYQWSLIATPAGSSASLSSLTSVQTELDADLAGDYVVQLIVDDGVLQSAPNTVLIRVSGLPNLSVFVSPLVGGGLQVGGSGTLGSTNHGGISVRVESLDPTRLLVAPDTTSAGNGSVDIFVPDGVSTYNFVAQGVARQAGPVEVTASASGFADASRMTEVAPPGLSFAALNNPVSAGVGEGFIVYSGVANAAGNGLSSLQGVSAAALPLTLTLRSDDPSIGNLSLGGTTGDQVELDLAAGDFQTLATFNALAAGSVELSADLTDSASLASWSETILVDPPSISAFSRTIGAGLQFSSQGGLGLSNHGGITLRVESSDPGLARVSVDATTPGSSFVDIFVPDGSSVFPYTVQGVANTTGEATVTVSAVGFESGTSTITIAPPGVAVTALGDSLTVGQSDTFAVLTGVANAAGTALSSLQRVSAGNDLELTLESTNGSVGELTLDGQTGSVVLRTLVAPEFQLFPVFGALAPGSTIVRASIPGFLFVPGDVSIEVTGP